MVANMPISAKLPQYSSSSGAAAAADHRPYPWRSLQKPSVDSVAEYGTHHTPVPTEESSNSWGRRAYAGDGSTLLVGIWPPRAYPCGFCHRQFRSAQALGGHMNVHRRDRARLRQSSPPAPCHSSLCSPLQKNENNLHKSSQLECSPAGLSPSADYPMLFPDQSLSETCMNGLPTTAISNLLAISYRGSTASLAANYPADMAAAFPLRLQLLASEAASALLLPQAESSDLLSPWPSLAGSSRNYGCSSTGIKIDHAIDRAAWSGLPSCSSSSSTVPSTDTVGHINTASFMGSKSCRLASSHSPPAIQPEDESPKKKSNLRNSSSMDDRTNPEHQIRDSDTSMKVNGSSHGGHVLTQSIDRDNHSECLDLELRLGHRPP